MDSFIYAFILVPALLTCFPDQESRRQPTIAGVFNSRWGQVIRFQSAYGDTNRLLRWINLTTRAARAVLSLPLGLGGQRFTINDLTIADNGPCV